MKVKKLIQMLTSRMAICGLLILVQVLFLLWVLVFLTQASAIAGICLEVISLGVVVWMSSKAENPSYKLAWMILVMALPIVGGAMYFVFGHKRPTRKLTEQVKDYYSGIRPYFGEGESVLQELSREDTGLGRQAAYIVNVSGFPVFRNSSCEYCESGEIKFQRLLEELEKAQRFIWLEYFILEEGQMWNAVHEILRRKVREGVEVRVMYDDMGCIQTLPTRYWKRLQAEGMKVVVFNPFRPHVNPALNYRDHRKIVVIDGNTGFTGGINLADEYINAYPKHGHWKDTAVIIKGEAVWSLSLMFLQLWRLQTGLAPELEQYRPTEYQESDGYVQPYGDAPIDDQNVAESVYMQIINGASQYVYIMTPYLILDNEMVTALTIAAHSGIDVRIITPHIPDKQLVHAQTRSFYPPLIESGVKIYEYTPGFVHAKVFVADDKVATVGTTNMDYRSFYLHFECGVAFYHSSVVYSVKKDFLATLQKCQAVTYREAASTFWKRIGRAFLRIFAPLM